MKKTLLLITIILTSTLLLVGCSSKVNALTNDEFKKISEDNDLTIIDSSESFSEDEKVDSVLIAYNGSLQLEYYNMKEESHAKDMFESNKQTFIEKKENTSSEESKSGSNYEIYSLITSDEYMYVERRDKTILYLRVPVSLYSEARDLLEKYK